ncbi:MAG: hypothetical protein CSB48_11025 [Proteobacteria bacterium]|nr:MAG: hypothetical protein CSB48_11025 [Pseudomonadota bacterium]PIE40070.1 MAG: hypothetical protein CSA51_02785 [Gammaproteobacteria bacterium]
MSYHTRFFNRFFALIATCWLSVFSQLVYAGQVDSHKCYFEEFCVTVEQVEQNVDMFTVTVQSVVDYPLNIFIDFKLDNLTLQAENEEYYEIGPGETLLVNQFSVENSDEPFNYSFDFTWSLGSIDTVHDAGFLYYLPFPEGMTSHILRGYDVEVSPENRYAVIFALPEGTPVLAAREGVVRRVDTSAGNEELCANYIYIEHSDGTFGGYCNLKTQSAKVSVGSVVRKGQAIAESGVNLGIGYLYFRVISPLNAKDILSHEGLFRSTDGIIGLYEGDDVTSVHEEDDGNEGDGNGDNNNEGDGNGADDNGGNGDTDVISYDENSSAFRIQSMYVAYYGRAADYDGLAWWKNRIEEKGGDLADIINAFGRSPEYDSRFGHLPTADLISNLYLQMFGRLPENAGLVWWTDEIDSGRVTLPEAALAIADGARNEDTLVLKYRTIVSMRITNAVKQQRKQYLFDQIELVKLFVQAIDIDDDPMEVGISNLIGSLPSLQN